MKELQNSFFKMVTFSLLGSISVFTIAVLVAHFLLKGGV